MKSHFIGVCLLALALPQFVPAQIMAPARVRVSTGVMQELLIKRVNPTYPPLARQARIQGTVILKVQIGKSGDVENVELVSGHPMLAPAAIEAVKQWKYKTYLLNGEPIAVETHVQVSFMLSDKPPADGSAGDAPAGPPQGGIAGTVDAATTPLPPPPQRVRISSGVMQGLLTKRVNPAYPSDARDQRIQGVVLLTVIIDKEGNVSTADLISGHPLLAPAAIDAVRQWKYKPYLLNGQAVEIETQVQVNFTLLGK